MIVYLFSAYKILFSTFLFHFVEVVRDEPLTVMTRMLETSIATMSEIKQILEKKVNKKTVNASKISTTDCNENGLDVVRTTLERNTPTLHSYNDTSVSDRIFNMILKYSELMTSQRSEGNVGEEAYVQPVVTKDLWPEMKKCLRHKEHVQWISERSFHSVSLSDNLIVNGITDHVIFLQNSDFCALTIEDKAVGADFPSCAFTQVRSQMTAEIRKMFTAEIPYIPKKYVGILQNGFDWVFVYCIHRGAEYFWSRVHTPTTDLSKCDDEEVYRNNCRTTAQYIEDALFIAERIVDDLLSPAVPTSVHEQNDEDDNGSNQDDYQDEDEDETNAKATEELSSQFASALSMNQTQNRNNQNNGTKKKEFSKISKRNIMMDHHDKENFATLSQANLSKVGVQKYLFLR